MIKSQPHCAQRCQNSRCRSRLSSSLQSLLLLLSCSSAVVALWPDIVDNCHKKCCLQLTHSHTRTHTHKHTHSSHYYEKSHSNLLAFFCAQRHRQSAARTMQVTQMERLAHTHTHTYTHSQAHTQALTGISNLVFTTFFCVAFLFRTRTQLLIKQPQTHTHTHT